MTDLTLTIPEENYERAKKIAESTSQPIEQVILQVQPEGNYVWGKVKYYDPTQEFKLDGKVVPSILLGAGGAIPMGGAGAMIIMGHYDILQNERTPYGNKVFFSIGYNIGF